jgi:hypothetical protein
MKKPTNPVILHYVDTRHSRTCFGTIKCHYQGLNHDPAEIDAQCCRNLKGRLKHIIKNHKTYINGTKGALVGIIDCYSQF